MAKTISAMWEKTRPVLGDWNSVSVFNHCAMMPVMWEKQKPVIEDQSITEFSLPVKYPPRLRKKRRLLFFKFIFSTDFHIQSLHPGVLKIKNQSLGWSWLWFSDLLLSYWIFCRSGVRRRNLKYSFIFFSVPLLLIYDTILCPLCALGVLCGVWF